MSLIKAITENSDGGAQDPAFPRANARIVISVTHTRRHPVLHARGRFMPAILHACFT